MRRKMFFFVFVLLLFYTFSVLAQGLTTEAVIEPQLKSNVSELIYTSDSTLESGQSFGFPYDDEPVELLFSPSVSQKFYEIAYDLAKSEDAEGPKVEEAIIFLTAALSLDENSEDVCSLLIECASRNPERDYFDMVYDALVSYINEFADLNVAMKGISYLLELVNLPEEKEELLENTLKTFGNKNSVLGSELATLLGLLNAEKSDLKAAEYYFLQAYQSNAYNKQAFINLAEIAPERISEEMYLEHLRLALRENPTDLGAAIIFAEYAEQLQLYELAAMAYEYCADLFVYLYPYEILPARIYLPWAISCYNTQRNLSKCQEIAELIREKDKFDLILEAIAGKAAMKLGDGELATQILQDAAQKARILARRQKQNPETSVESQPENLEQFNKAQLAWFYCFVIPLEDRALTWAKEAYSTQENSTTASIMAYAHVMNNEIQEAKQLVQNNESNQISDLVLAQIQIAEGQNAQAVQTLQTSIARDPGSFEAEQAKELLAQQGIDYTPDSDPDSVLLKLEESFGQKLIPVFMAPEQTISADLNIRNREIAFGGELNGVIIISNNSPEPLIISDDGLFRGNIRIDAKVSGDVSKQIPNLVLTKTRKAFLIESGSNILIPVKLVTGELRKTLTTYPQASLNIEFTLYLDPIKTEDGSITNRLTYIAPVRKQVKRPGIELTGKYLRSRFNAISTGQIGQKIQTAELFTGLMLEQHAITDGGVPYDFMYADWMETMLRSGLIYESGLLRNPENGEWLVKLYTMAGLLPLPLDYELLEAISENMSSVKWPVRMMAIYLLAKNSKDDFKKVLDWVATNDQNIFVRHMAIVLARSASK